MDAKAEQPKGKTGRADQAPNWFKNSMALKNN